MVYMSHLRSSTDPTEQAIIKTLCYSDVFDYPLTRGEIYTYLLTPYPTTQKTINQATHKLVQKGSIIVSGRVGGPDIFFALPKRQPIFSLRKKRFHAAHKKQKITRRVGKWLKKIPTIRAVFITGALAMANTDEKDDIDLMIITKTGWLWTTRLITNIFLDSQQTRRKPEHTTINQIVNKICTNLYLDDSHLAMSPQRHNLFTAHEVVQAKLLWQRGSVNRDFLTANAWISQFLPHSPLLSISKSIPSSKQKNNKPTKPVHFVEKIAFQAQTWYMKNKITNEEVNLHSAFFHPRKTSQLVLDEYQKKLAIYL